MRTQIDRAETARLRDQVVRGFAHAMTFPTVEHDFSRRQRYIGAVADPTWIYRDAPSFDVAYNALDGNGFWLNVRHLDAPTTPGASEMIAHCAVRVWRGVHLRDLFVESRFFQERDSGHSISFEPVEADQVRGTLAFIGSAWVHPDYRRRGLPALLMAFSQLHLLEEYECDYALGLIDDKAAQAGMGARTWRFHHHHSGATWTWPDRGQLPVWLIYNNRADMLGEVRRCAAEAEQAAAARPGNGAL